MIIDLYPPPPTNKNQENNSHIKQYNVPFILYTRNDLKQYEFYSKTWDVRLTYSSYFEGECQKNAAYSKTVQKIKIDRKLDDCQQEQKSYHNTVDHDVMTGIFLIGTDVFWKTNTKYIQ